MIALRLINRRRVHLVGSILLPMSDSMVWGQMRSFTYFVGLDPFHGPVHSAEKSRPIETGSPIFLGHRFGPLRLNRVGRILRWREGQGYSFSDLSQAGNRAGFPHIFTYDLQKRPEDCCRLTITVRGHWTGSIWPEWFIRRWLMWVLGHTLHSAKNNLLIVALHNRATV